VPHAGICAGGGPKGPFLPRPPAQCGRDGRTWGLASRGWARRYRFMILRWNWQVRQLFIV
jgi:hypothetical protein